MSAFQINNIFDAMTSFDDANDVKSFVKQNTKCTCSHLSEYMLEWGTRVNACPNGGTWVNACLNGGGLLQDTVSLMGDMVHLAVMVGRVIAHT
jgi:hypothetical protein